MELKNISLLNLMRTFDIGGTEKWTIQLSNFICSRIHKTIIMAQKGLYAEGNIISPDVQKHFIPFKLNFNPFLFFLNLISILKVIKNENVNCINYQQRIFLPYILFIKLFFKKIKLIYTGHAVFNDWLNKFLIADIYIAVSDAVQRNLFKANKKKVILIRYGMEVKDNLEIKEFKKNDELTFGYIGRFYKGKGIHLLLKAFDSFHKTFPKHKLIFKGDGPLLSYIKKYIQANSLTHCIAILPPELDINKIFNEIDILIFPTEIQEGMGLILIEAMANNISIIKSHFINDDDAFNEDACYLVKPGDESGLLSAMNETVTNSEKRIKLLNNANRIAKEKFKLKRFIEDYESLIQEL